MITDELLNEYKSLSDQTKKAEKAARLLREQADVYKKAIIDLCKDTGYIVTDTLKATVTEIQVAGFQVAPRTRYDVKISSNVSELVEQ